MPTLSYKQAQRFYDRFGRKQDGQAYYEDAALQEMISLADFDSSSSLLEFGCGTGRLGEIVLSKHLPPTARYVGIDISSVMIGLTRERLARFGDRVSLHQTDGCPRLDLPDDSFDRFVSTYVIDLLADGDAAELVREAHRVLRPDGLMCLVGLSDGCSLISRFVSSVWNVLHRLRPQWVGGCRPVELKRILAEDYWQIVYSSRVASWGIPSEVLVARRVTQIS